MGKSYFQSDQFDKAIEYLQKAVELEPNNLAYRISPIVTHVVQQLFNGKEFIEDNLYGIVSSLAAIFIVFNLKKHRDFLAAHEKVHDKKVHEKNVAQWSVVTKTFIEGDLQNKGELTNAEELLILKELKTDDIDQLLKLVLETSKPEDINIIVDKNGKNLSEEDIEKIKEIKRLLVYVLEAKESYSDMLYNHAKNMGVEIIDNERTSLPLFTMALKALKLIKIENTDVDKERIEGSFKFFKKIVDNIIKQSQEEPSKVPQTSQHSQLSKEGGRTSSPDLTK